MGGEKTKKIKLQMLRRKYELLQMENNENVTDYFNRVQKINNQMKANGEVMIEVVIIEKILRTLTQIYDHIVVDQDEEVGGSRSHQNNDNKSKKPSGKKKFDKKAIQCYNCKKYGHFADECISKKVQRDDGEAQLAQADSSDSDEMLLMASTSMEDDFPGLWYLDTRRSIHMIGHKCWFISIDEKVKTEIRFADNNTIKAEGVGKILIQRMDDKQSFICDVLYVPNMKNNVLSLGQLLEK
ncbi:uncharacterized protein [Cicer arietinum]|uniref:Uncharacterized protein LOC113785445 n=1 Tax=Cicer arietinum TaxID=3827 RepID=A0A3Q7X1H8_CICAR|nr:uncharacterized protein LOC113785445 [Cicer arietinum]